MVKVLMVKMDKNIQNWVKFYYFRRGIAYCLVGMILGGYTGTLYWSVIDLTGLTSDISFVIAGAFVGGGIGGINGFLMGYYDLYSHGWRGIVAFISDSTWDLLITAIGLFLLLYLYIRGDGYFSMKYSKQTNSLIFIGVGDVIKSSGLALGNVIAVKYNEGDIFRGGFLRLLRHELAHPWQYRIGSLFAAIKLGQEMIMGPFALKFYNPYKTSWNLENQAEKYSERGKENRPWFLRSKEFDKLYL